MMIGVSHHFLLWRTKLKNSASEPRGLPAAACRRNEVGSCSVGMVGAVSFDGNSFRWILSGADYANSSEPSGQTDCFSQPEAGAFPAPKAAEQKKGARALATADVDFLPTVRI